MKIDIYINDDMIRHMKLHGHVTIIGTANTIRLFHDKK